LEQSSNMTVKLTHCQTTRCRIRSRIQVHSLGINRNGCIQHKKDLHVLSIIQAAGWPIWFLLLCSIIGLALIIERGISLRSAAVFSTAARDHAYELARQAHPSAEQIQRLQKTNALRHIYASLLQNKD